MRVSRDQMAENRGRILDAAAAMVRERGFETLTVAEVMKAAGLTHGGFYGHFRSKEDLLAQACAQAVRQTDKPDLTLREYAAVYLSPEHVADRARGCPLAALASEAARESVKARTALTEGLRAIVAGFAPSAPGSDEAERRRRALGSFATMLGGVVLARLVEDPDLSGEILQAALLAVEDRDPAAG